MKDKFDTGNFSDRDWEELASSLSQENGSLPDLPGILRSEDGQDIINKWKGLRMTNYEQHIDVDKAWGKLSSRLSESGSFGARVPARPVFIRSAFLRIAAVALILLSAGGVMFYLITKGYLSEKMVFATGADQKNQIITLPDLSTITLNRNTRLSYRKNFGDQERKVSLAGEAFFKITADSKKPFIIDAGKAKVKVIGTSFNVLTKNNNSAVEVYVRTGTVMLSDNSGTREMMIGPDYVGTMDSKENDKKLNVDPNYMSWNSGLLVFTGQTLRVVFRDLKKVYNMDIVADDPGILNSTWVSKIDNQPQDTIIRLICTSFNLSYTKDGNVFHLARK